MAISNTVRSALVAAALGAATATLLAAVVIPTATQTARAQNAAPQSTVPAGGISIDNFTFAPASLTVKAGTTVTWTNRDDIPHGIAESNNAFKKSKALDTDDSFSFTFTTPGTYKYFCYIHPHMVGTVVVEAASGSNATQ
jgi:plastocyanin